MTELHAWEYVRDAKGEFIAFRPTWLHLDGLLRIFSAQYGKILCESVCRISPHALADVSEIMGTIMHVKGNFFFSFFSPSISPGTISKMTTVFM